MIFEHNPVLRCAPNAATPRRRAPRRFQPAFDGVERLEARELLHGGPVVGHASAVVGRVQAPPADPTAEIQQALAASYAAQPGTLLTIQTRDATILLPSGLVPGRTYPLVVAFAYNGNPSVPFQVWRTQAQANTWIVYASKDYKNAVLTSGLASSNATAARIKSQIDSLSTILPVDRTRIIFTGMSGGANFSDFMNLRYPGYAAGVIINSGEIPAQLFHKTPARGFLTMPTAADFAGSRRVGVFLASPSDTDFYGITQSNSKLMQTLGWNTLFLSFPGGHWNAPAATYTRAIQWILSQPAWTASP